MGVSYTEKSAWIGSSRNCWLCIKVLVMLEFSNRWKRLYDVQDVCAYIYKSIYHFRSLFVNTMLIQSSFSLNLQAALVQTHFSLENDIVWIPKGRSPLTRQLTHCWTTGWLRLPEWTNAQSETDQPCVVNNAAGSIPDLPTGHTSSCTNSCSYSYTEINSPAP